MVEEKGCALFDLSWLELRELTELKSITKVKLINHFLDDHIECGHYEFVDDKNKKWSFELWWIGVEGLLEFAKSKKALMKYIVEQATEELSTMGGDYFE